MVNCVRCERRAKRSISKYNKELSKTKKRVKKSEIMTMEDYKDEIREAVIIDEVEKLCRECHDELYKELIEINDEIDECNCDKHCESCDINNKKLDSCLYFNVTKTIDVEIIKNCDSEYTSNSSSESDNQDYNMW